MNRPPLVIAAHGTRLATGVAACQQLVELVRAQLPGVSVEAGYVELVEPTIDAALAPLLEQHGRAVVVPLMVGTGAHVRRDIPGAIAAARSGRDARVAYAPHLGPHPLLLHALAHRIAAARADWAEADTTVVLVGRGSLTPEANADHARLARLVAEAHGFADVMPGWIQVTHPSLPEALDRAHALGARRIVVAPHFLFPGRLQDRVDDQATAWATAHPDATVRIADVLGPCPELAGVVVERYHDACRTLPSTGAGSPVYLAGLDLRGRRVLVVGAGAVAARRVPGLVAAGAQVHVIAPDAHPDIAALAQQRRLTWDVRRVRPADIAAAWYVLAATDEPDVNAVVTRLAEAAHTFCVRADDAPSGTAWTPTVTHVGTFSVGVIGDRDPRGSRALRDRIAHALSEEPA